MRRHNLFSTRSFWSDEKDQPTQMHINCNTYIEQTDWNDDICLFSRRPYSDERVRLSVRCRFPLLVSFECWSSLSFFNRERILFVSTNCDKKNRWIQITWRLVSNRRHRTMKKTILNFPFCVCKFCFDFYVSIHTGAVFARNNVWRRQAKTEKTHRNNERQKCKIRLYAIPHTSVEAIKPLWRPKQLVEICSAYYTIHTYVPAYTHTDTHLRTNAERRATFVCVWRLFYVLCMAVGFFFWIRLAVHTLQCDSSTYGYIMAMEVAGTAG